MKKYLKLIPIYFILFFVCCSNVSDIVFERFTEGNRGIEEITEAEESFDPKEVFIIIPPLFSVEGKQHNPLMPSRFDNGRIDSSIFHIQKTPFWNIPELIEPFYFSLLTKIQKKENEGENINVSSEEEITPSISSYEIVSYESNSSQDTICCIEKVTLETKSNATLSYSLDGETYESYSEPIEITEPATLIVKTTLNDNSVFFLSTKVSCSASNNS
ncbi:MAG: hypothetical protein MSS69_11225 [Spirochaetales bacterium]|nr:hypothetical protein [Spirochaetales bacterium]